MAGREGGRGGGREGEIGQYQIKRLVRGACSGLVIGILDGDRGVR